MKLVKTLNFKFNDRFLNFLFLRLSFPFFLLFTLNSNGQLVNAENYPFSTELDVLLEDMTDATIAIGAYREGYSEETIAFGDGFTSCMAGICYDSLIINSRGIVRLGNQFSHSILLNTRYTSIAPMRAVMSTGNNGFVKYKIVGSAPNRKFVVHWQVHLQSSLTFYSALDEFQLWIHEKGGIEFVYGDTPTYWDGSFSESYQIGFTYNNPTFGAEGEKFVGIETTDDFVDFNADYDVADDDIRVSGAIPSGAKLSFLPDTMPVNLPLVEFLDVSASCIEFVIHDTTENEYGFKVLKSEDGITYDEVFDNLVTDTDEIGDLYYLKDSILVPETDYYYAVIPYGLFLTLDTLFFDTTTVAPQMSGVKRIPGDYETIGEALNAINCLQIESHLILELGEDYDSELEVFPILMNENHNTDFDKTITIRPAPEVDSVVIKNLTDTLMFVFDNAKHIKFDGRPGGYGDENALFIFQDNSAQSAISLRNNSSNNEFFNCNFLGKGRDNRYAESIIYIGENNNSYNIFDGCYFAPFEDDWIENIILAEGDVELPNINNSIQNCAFKNFGQQTGKTGNGDNSISAIGIKDGNSDYLIKGNSFYFTDTLIGNDLTNCISVRSEKGNNFRIRENWFGGAEVEAGGEKMEIVRTSSSTNSGFQFIELRADSIVESSVSKNTIKNVHINYIWGGRYNSTLIFTRCDNVLIDSNRIGDPEIYQSVFYEGNDSRVEMSLIKNTAPCLDCYQQVSISNNEIYGVEATGGINLSLIRMAYSSSAKSRTIISGNILGGEMDKNIISESGLEGIRAGVSLNDTIIVSNNIIRNLHNKNWGLNGIIMESNTIIDGPLDYICTRVTDNKVYKLTSENLLPYLDDIIGICVKPRNNPIIVDNNEVFSLTQENLERDGYVVGISNSYYVTTGFVIISNNFVHSLQSKGARGDIAGIISRTNTKIENNMISLGRDDLGQTIQDSCSIFGIAIHFSDQDSTIINHNSIYLEGDSLDNYYYGECKTISIDRWPSPIEKNIIITNNIFASDGYYPLVDYATIFEDDYVEVCDYNQYFMGNDDRFDEDITFEDWQERGKDLNSFFAPHRFINTDGGIELIDLHLQEDNYSEGQGTLSELTTDIDGDIRGDLTPTDIGADAGDYFRITPLSFSSDTIFACIGDSILLDVGRYDTYSWSTGEITETIIVDSTSLVSVIVVDRFGNVFEDSTYIFIDTIFPVLTPISDTIFCYGDTISVSTSDGDYHYEWSSGDSTASVNFFEAGEYIVKVFTFSGCLAVDTVEIFYDSIYSNEYTATYNICEEDSLFVELSPITYDYIWDDVYSGNSFYLMAVEDSISLKVTSPLGCVLNDTIITAIQPKYNVVDAEMTICEGDSLLIYGVYQFTSGVYYDSLISIMGCDSIKLQELIVNPVFYSVLPDAFICANDSVLIFGEYKNTSGSYYDSLSSVFGCDSIIKQDIIVYDLPTVTFSELEDEIVCVDSEIFPMFGEPLGGVFIGPGIIGSNFYPSRLDAGDYKLYYRYQDDNECFGTDSVEISLVDCLGLDEWAKQNILIYPNPSSDFVTLQFNETAIGEYTIVVNDILGKEIYRKINNFEANLVISKSEFTGVGEFIISIYNEKTGSRIYTEKIIIL